MKKLFMFAIGGDFANSNIELHDVRFAIGAREEDCYPELHRQWWGSRRSLHLDAWGAVEQADGHDLVLANAPEAEGAKLFFINLGGYNATEFGELHKNLLLVARSPAQAKSRALKQITGWAEPHKDALFELDKTIDLSAEFARHGVHLQLKPAALPTPFSFTCGYIPIGKMPGTYPNPEAIPPR